MKQIDPLSNHLREVLDFLVEIFELGFEYSTINTHRSVISTSNEPIEEFSVAKHPKVWNLMTSVFNKGPGYCFVLGIETIPRDLRSLPINKIMSTKMLTLKLIMLLTSTSASKYSKIRYLDIRFYTKPETKFYVNMIKPAKTTKPNKPLPELEFQRFQDDNNICVFETVEKYIFRAKLGHEK